MIGVTEVAQKFNFKAPIRRKFGVDFTHVKAAHRAAIDVNAVALQQVADEIDVVTAASCPSARDALLKVLKMQSLQQAVR